MTEFQTVAKDTGIAPGSMHLVDLSGREVVVANVGGTHFAFDNRCTCIAQFAGHIEPESTHDHHVGESGRLVEGKLEGDTVICSQHSTVYNVRTGRPLSGPGETPLNTYEVQLDQGDIRVAMMPDAARHFWNDPGSKQRP